MVLEYTLKTKTTLRNTGIGLLVGGIAGVSGTLIYVIVNRPINNGSAPDIVAKTTIGIAAGSALTGTTLLVLGLVAKVKK